MGLSRRVYISNSGEAHSKWGCLALAGPSTFKFVAFEVRLVAILSWEVV